jgi:hypothetical protein
MGALLFHIQLRASETTVYTDTYIYMTIYIYTCVSVFALCYLYVYVSLLLCIRICLARARATQLISLQVCLIVLMMTGELISSSPHQCPPQPPLLLPPL